MDQQGTRKQENLKQPVVTKQQALRMLETYFGYTSFRPAQEVDLVLQGLSDSTVTGTAILRLASDGKIRLTSKSPGNKYWTGTVTYITNDTYP